MNAELFNSHEVEPPIVTTASNGQPLPGGFGWSCAACGSLYVKREQAEACCHDEALAAVEPDLVV